MSAIPGLQGSPTGVPSLFNSIGIPLGKVPLQLLTIFPPTGYLGLNLTAAGLPITSALKAASYGLGVLIGIYGDNLYMNQVAHFLSYVLIFAPPWYIFDCIQILTDTKFNENGFVLPVPFRVIPSGGGKGGNWTLTFPLLSLILAATSFSSLAFLNAYIPSVFTGNVGKYIQYGVIALGVLFSGSALFSIFKQSPNSVSTATSIPTDISSLTSGLVSMGEKMTGGGNNSLSSSSNKVPPLSFSSNKLPPLSSFIDNLKPQNGGSSESIPFIGILALIVLGGFSLSFLRSKHE